MYIEWEMENEHQSTNLIRIKLSASLSIFEKIQEAFTMIIVTNKIKTKLGFAEKMAPMFTRPGDLQKMDGFVKVEVLITKNLTEYDELNVNMYWDTLEDFTRWRKSDVFKEAHRGPENSEEVSPILGSEIIISELASTLDKA